MKTLFFLSLIFLLNQNYAAAAPVQLGTKPISSNDHLLNGNIPYIKGKKFKPLDLFHKSKINHWIVF